MESYSSHTIFHARSQGGGAMGANAPTHRGPSSTKIVKKVWTSRGREKLSTLPNASLPIISNLIFLPFFSV